MGLWQPPCIELVIMNFKITLIFTFILVSTSIAGCASIFLGFSAEPITATIVDADTKQPLKDVNVVAHWQLVGGGSFVDSSGPAGELMVMEAVTDTDGKFHFPSWGPIYDFMGRMHNDDPELIFFKPGYEYKALSNRFITTEIKDYQAVRSSDWNGKTIELKVFKGSMKEYASNMVFMTTDLNSILSHDCGWKKITKTLLNIDKVSRELRKQGFYSLPSIESLNIRYKNKEKECGSVIKYFIDLGS